ncbi:MAG: hypothetical protein IKV44_02870 [Clostridia bacterium]|nr:hypothetical protein [Clostridia bacterium]
MKYLVVGDSNSMHIFNFVKTFLLPKGYEVHLLTLSTQRVREEYRQFYKEHNVTLHSVAEKGYKGLDKTNKVYRLLNLWRKTRLMKEVPQVDVCHVHSVYKTSLAMVLQNKNKFKHLILSYWGSDIRDKTPSVLELREKCFEIADAITVTVEQTLNDFREIHGNKYDNKLSICRFATDGLNCIKGLSESITREDCRRAYNVPEGKVVVTCGYSATSEQHQEQILEELQKMPKELRSRIFAIVPMQYGPKDDAYFAMVEAAKNNADFPCVILKDYVPFDVSVQLAMATDFYLHMRDTDAFSNALKEHVFAGSQIIMGNWLKYLELEKMGADFVGVDSFGEMRQVLENKLESYRLKDNFNLFTPIYELYSTESVVEQWGKVVDKVINTNKEKI